MGEYLNNISRKYFRNLFTDPISNTNNAKNTDSFNVGELIRIEDTFIYSVEFASAQDVITTSRSLGTIQMLDGSYNPGTQYTQSGVDWYNEGFRVGDSVIFTYLNIPPSQFKYAVIQEISGDSFTVYQDFSDGNRSHTLFVMFLNSTLYDMDVYAEFQPIDSDDILQLHTNERYPYKLRVDSNFQFQDATYTNLNKSGRNKIIKGKLEADNIQSVNPYFLAVARKYVISYEMLLPFWLENNTLENFFKGDASLKFNTRILAKRSSDLPKDSIRILENLPKEAETGYFFENGNGGNTFLQNNVRVNNYDNINNSDIDILNPTRIVYRITTNFYAGSGAMSSGDAFSVCVFAKNSDYKYNEIGYKEAFGFGYSLSKIYNTTNINQAWNPITKIESGLGSDAGKDFIEVALTFDFNKYDYKERFKEGSEYRVLFTFVGLNNEVNTAYFDGKFIQNSDEEGLIDFIYFRIHNQFTNLISQNQNSLTSNIQDTVFLECYFTTSNVFGWDFENDIKSIKTGILAYKNDNETFEVNGLNIDLGTKNRGLTGELLLNSIYNSDYSLDKNDGIKLITTGSGFGNTSYKLQCPIKIGWQDWIENNEVAPVFYDETKDFYNFNRNSINYYNKFGYKIRIYVDVELYRAESGITTIYRQTSKDLIILDKNTGVGITPVEIKTFDLLNNDLNGKLLEGEETEIRAYFNHSGLTNFKAIFAYEEIEQNGFDAIENLTGGSLLGLWKSKPTFEITPTNVIAKARILGDGKAYNLSCKIQETNEIQGEYNFEYNNDYN